MIATIHQPEHLPYFGFLDKVNKSDFFIILDDVQFKKNNFQNRNQILTPNGPKWLSIPVEMSEVEDKNINVRRVKGEWKPGYRNQIVEAYKKYAFFEENLAWIDQMLSIQSDRLIDYNLFAMSTIFSLLNINTQRRLSSSMHIETFKTQRLYDLCKQLSASAYLAGQGAIDYLDETVFKDDIKILKHSFKHPEYAQKNSPVFVPYMSSLDFLMSIGAPGTKALLDESLKSSL